MRSAIRLLFALLCLGAGLAAEDIEVPEGILYQGRLKEDRFHVSGERDLSLRLYASADADEALWTETHAAVPVVDGLFQLVLGSVEPLDDATLSGAERWLEVEIQGEVLARTPLTSVPHARIAGAAGRADHASSADTASEAERAEIADLASAVAADSIDTAALIDGAVTEPKLAAALRARLAALDAAATESWTATGGRKTLGTASGDWADGLALDAAGNLYVTGYTDGDLAGQANAGGADIWLTKWDRRGVAQWTRLLGSAAGDFAFAACVDATGNVFTVGSSEGALPGTGNAGSWDVVISKWSPSGTVLWSRALGSPAFDVGFDCAVAADGRLLVAGYTFGTLPGATSAGDIDAFVAAWNPDGSQAWIHQFGSPAADFALSVDTDGDGIYAAGYTFGSLEPATNAGGSDVMVAALDTGGSERWLRQYGGPGNDFGRSVATTVSGGAVVLGDTDGAFQGTTPTGDRDLLLLNLDDSGALRWFDLHGSPAEERGVGVAVDHRDRIFATGTSWGDVDGHFNIGRQDFLVGAWSATGEARWTRLIGTPEWDFGFDIAVDGNSNIYAAGYTYGDLDGDGGGGADVLVAQLRPDGSAP